MDLSNVVDLDNLLVECSELSYRAFSVEVEVGIARFWVYKDCISVVWGCTAGKFNQSGLK